MTEIKKALRFALCLLPIGLLAGVFVGFYQLDIYGDDLIAEAVAQLGSTTALIVVGAVQTAGYALFCGFVGYILADKIGLWKPIAFEGRKLAITLAISVLGGAVFSLDHWTFGRVIDGIQASNAESLTVSGVLASILYGGVIEEVMMRLFFMSLLAFVLWKLFWRKCDREHIPTAVFITANILAAILFAAGHLPANLMLFGRLTPMILFRCFLLNGGFGLIFGWLYRRYGIVYAMISHLTFHIVSKLIWILFV
ncbi:MAG: CPBP family intramembrane metalloprotease [Clostridia bacterium]|nr:CPBP family intramembrane metalloprotease [Clostridia bacterium]